MPRPVGRPARRWWGFPRVERNVIGLGVTSLFTDISSEMITAILPLYLLLHLRLSPLQLGAVDGLYLGATALVRLVGGLAADRWRRHKEVAGLGYALSAASRLGLLLAGGVPWLIAAVIFVDRTGKGIRSSPRDALISLSSRRAGMATAFGVHRAFDTAGAMLGPLLAFGLLAAVPSGYDAVFVVSFCIALIGLGALALLVGNKGSDRSGANAVSLRAALGLLRRTEFRALVAAGSVLSLVTISDAFLFLAVQRRVALATGLFPLMYVGTSLAFMALALPAGRLADRLGRGRVFLAGYALLPACVGLLVLPGEASALTALLVLGLFGAYYAATDGVLMALASTTLPHDLRTTGLSVLTTATSLARLLASLLFGLAWTWWGMDGALLSFAVAVTAAVALSAVLLGQAGLLATAGRSLRMSWLRHRGCVGCPLSELHTCAHDA
jgi:MFS family permease